MKVGDIVECIDAQGQPVLELGRRYVVLGVLKRDESNPEEILIRSKPYKPDPELQCWCYLTSRFKVIG